MSRRVMLCREPVLRRERALKVWQGVLPTALQIVQIGEVFKNADGSNSRAISRSRSCAFSRLESARHQELGLPSFQQTVEFAEAGEMIEEAEFSGPSLLRRSQPLCNRPIASSKRYCSA
jgi:hypothetical protein